MRYRFQPRWYITLAVLALLPVLISLGLWQIDRAGEKADIRDRYETRGEMPPVDINDSRLAPERDEYRRATVRGRYREDLTIYLDNKVLNGVPGYEILTPLELIGEGRSAGRFILVNRGWIAWGETRETLPAVDTPAGVVELSGRLTTPPADYFTLEGEPAGGSEFSPLWQNLDLGRYEDVTGLPVSPLVLELAPGGEQDTVLVRQPRDYDDPWIERHRAYAVQWFGLAFVLVVLYLVLNLEKRDDE